MYQLFHSVWPSSVPYTAIFWKNIAFTCIFFHASRNSCVLQLFVVRYEVLRVKEKLTSEFFSPSGTSVKSLHHRRNRNLGIVLCSDNRYIKAQTMHDPNRHLHAQSQQWKHHTNVRNLFKVNNKDTKTTCDVAFWYL